MYRIPKEIQSATRIGRKITLADILFSGIWLGSTWGFGRLLVHSFYVIPYYVFSVLVMFHLLSPVKRTQKQKGLRAIFFT